MLNKVPEVTLYFWIIKVLCTTVGETAADYLNDKLGLGLTKTTYIMAAVPGRRRSSSSSGCAVTCPAIYWLAVVLISVVGTLITDNLTDNFGVSLVTTTIVFSIVLAVGVRGLVRERADALDPHDRHDPARGVLLADGAVHVRARHRGRRPDRRAARRRLLEVGAAVRRADRDRVRAAPAAGAQRDPGLLDRVHPHPAARRLDRRLPLAAEGRRRPGARDDRDERDLPAHDPRRRRLPLRDQGGRDRGRVAIERSSAHSARRRRACWSWRTRSRRRLP